jgi:hypothetical protein
MASEIHQCFYTPHCTFISSCLQFSIHASNLKGQLPELQQLKSSKSPSSEIKASITCHPCQDQSPSIRSNFTDEKQTSTSCSTTGVHSSLSSQMLIIHPTNAVRESSVVQQKEEYLIEKYTEVFRLLEAKWRGLQRDLAWETSDVFEDNVVRAVMASVRECMELNELAMEEGRRLLWEEFEDAGSRVQGVEKKGEEAQVERIDHITIVGDQD